jgi:hypothetical protein
MEEDGGRCVKHSVDACRGSLHRCVHLSDCILVWNGLAFGILARRWHQPPCRRWLRHRDLGLVGGGDIKRGDGGGYEGGGGVAWRRMGGRDRRCELDARAAAPPAARPSRRPFATGTRGRRSTATPSRCTRGQRTRRLGRWRRRLRWAWRRALERAAGSKKLTAEAAWARTSKLPSSAASSPLAQAGGKPPEARSDAPSAEVASAEVAESPPARAEVSVRSNAQSCHMPHRWGGG